MTDPLWPPLPDLGDLIRDDSVWPYPTNDAGGEEAARLRVWSTTTRQPSGVLAVVTELGLGSPFASITNCAEGIWWTLTTTYPGELVVLEHYPPGESGPEHFDQMRVLRDGRPDWRRIWPTTIVNPHHGEFTRWMERHGPALLGRHTGPAGDPARRSGRG